MSCGTGECGCGCGELLHIHVKPKSEIKVKLFPRELFSAEAVLAGSQQNTEDES